MIRILLMIVGGLIALVVLGAGVLLSQPLWFLLKDSVERYSWRFRRQGHHRR